MSIDQGTRPELPVGSSDWVKALSIRETDHCRDFTSSIDAAAEDVLGDTFAEAAWDKMFARDENVAKTMYTKARGISKFAPTMIVISQKFDWSVDNPEFRYTAAQLVTHLAEKLGGPKDQGDLVVFKIVDEKRVEVPQEPPKEVSLEGMQSKLAEYAEKHGIDEDRQADLRNIARVPLLSDSRKTRALGLLQRKGQEGLIRYMKP